MLVRNDTKDGELWEVSSGVYGVEHHYGYGFEACADIGESFVETCVGGCGTFAEGIETDGTLDTFWAVWESMTEWFTFNYDQWMYLGVWDGISDPADPEYYWFNEDIKSKCSTAMTDFASATGRTCSQEQAEANAIQAISTESDTYQGTDDGSDSSLTLTVNAMNDTTVRSLYSGAFSFGFGVPRTCEEGVCSMVVGALDGHAYDDFVTDGEHTVDLTQMKFYLNGDAPASYNSATKEFVIAEGDAEFIFEYMFGSKYGNYILPNTSDISGTIDFEDNTFSIEGTFSNSDATLELDIVGDITARPPIVETIIPETIECSTRYAAEYVPDGTSPPYDVEKSHVWLVEHNEGFVPDDEQVAMPSLFIPMELPAFGQRAIRHFVFDDRRVYNFLDVETTVVDTTPPYLSVRTPHAETCIPAPSWVYLEGVSFSVNDVCTDPETINISGEIIEINTVKLSEPIPVSTDPEDENYLMAYLPLGTHKIQWEATDEFGNQSALVQEFTVDYVPGEHCCERSYTLWEGTPSPDVYIAHWMIDPVWTNQLMSLCAFGYEAADIVLMANAFEPLPEDEVNDYINFGEGGTAGWGGGFLQWRPGESTIVSESGRDIIVFHQDGNDNQFFDMGGDDDIQGSNGTAPGSVGADTVFGGFGDDFITTMGGPDFIVPGPGKDTVRAGEGDDEVVVYNVCEFVAGEYIDGGPGYDRLYMPVPKEVATTAFGIQILGFEEYIVDNAGAMTGFADCAIVYE